MFNWFSWKKPSKKIEIKPKKKRARSFFDDLFNRRSYNALTLLELVQSRAITVKPENFLKVAPGTTLDSAQQSAMDGMLQSTAFNLVANIPEALLGWYGNQNFIGYSLCAIIAQNWLVNKACTMPARDAIRNGYKVTVNDGTEIKPEVFDYIRTLDKKFKIKNSMLQYVRMGKIFGIRVAMFDIESTDGEFYQKPFNIDGVRPGTYKGIIQIDPYWITPELDFVTATDPTSRNFYVPTYWFINGKRYHRSHLVIYTTNEVPDVLKPTYRFGGVPLTQQIYERVYAAERTANEGPRLAMTKRLNIQKIDTNAMISEQGAFEERALYQSELRDNMGTLYIGREDEAQQLDTSLTDLDATIMNQYQLVSAIACVPATKLLGTQPKGFNSTGDYEAESYREELESMQEHDLTPLLQRHHELLIKSEVAPKFNIAPFSTEIVWEPLDSPTDKEFAETQLIKSQAAKNLSEIGAIDGADERARLIADESSGYSGMIAEEEDDIDESPDSTIQKLSLNGPQIAAIVDLINQVASGQIPRESGIEILQTAFPLEQDQAESIMGEVGKGFVQEKPPAPELTPPPTDQKAVPQQQLFQ